MEIMKKFMKFCFVLALVLIIVGGVLYMLGRKSGGRNEMDEMLSNIGGDWVDIDGLVADWGFDDGFVYDIEDSSMFSDDYDVWSGDVDKQLVCQGSIDELYLEIGGSMVGIEASGDGNVYIEGKNLGKMQAYVEDGVLYVKSVRPAHLAQEMKNSTVTLYLPNTSIHLLDVSLGAGQLDLEHLAVQNMAASVGAGQLLLEDIALGTLEVSLGAGELRTEDVTVESLNASISAGNMYFSGGVYGSAEISCSMGNVSMELEGEQADFNYQLNCVAGSMEIDGNSYSGASVDHAIDNGAAKYMEIDCSMGNVEVDFK